MIPAIHDGRTVPARSLLPLTLTLRRLERSKGERSDHIRRRRSSALTLFLVSCLLLLATACASVANPEGWAGPRLADDTLYVSIDKGKMAALDSEDLSVRWVFPPNTDEGKKLKLEGIYGAPAVSKDTIYFGAYDSHVYALNSEDGTPLWRFKTGDKIVNTVTLADDGTLYVGSTDGNLYAIDTEMCTNACPSSAIRTFDTGSSIWGSPLVTERLIYVPAMDGRLHALTPDDLTPTQGFSFKADAGLLTDLVFVFEDTLAVGGIDETLYAIDSLTGEQKWTVEAGNWFWGRPRVEDGIIYVPNLDGSVYALEQQTGDEKWSFEAGAAVRSSPILVRDVQGGGNIVVVIDKDGQLYGLDPESGALQWGGIAAPRVIDKTILSDPLLLGDEVLVVAQGGDLYRVDPATGAPTLVQVAP